MIRWITMSEEYAISSWPNTSVIYEKLSRLVETPIQPIKRESMDVYLKYFEEKCGKSKEMILF